MVLNNLKRLLGLTHEINSKEYRREIYMYFYQLQNTYPLDFVSSIKVNKNKNNVIILIESNRPGLIIGKGGQTIDGLKNSLCKHFNEDISFKIKENNVWNKLF